MGTANTTISLSKNHFEVWPPRTLDNTFSFLLFQFTVYCTGVSHSAAGGAGADAGTDVARGGPVGASDAGADVAEGGPVGPVGAHVAGGVSGGGPDVAGGTGGGGVAGVVVLVVLVPVVRGLSF